VALSLARLPRYLVLEPVSTVRFEVNLARPVCEIDVELENPKPGRSFLLLIGPQGGPTIQRMRLNGRARILFEPSDDRAHVLMLANPQKEPLVLRLRGRAARRSLTGESRPPTEGSRAARRSSRATVRTTKARAAARAAPTGSRSAVP
jgi:hypothetical protein